MIATAADTERLSNAAAHTVAFADPLLVFVVCVRLVASDFWQARHVAGHSLPASDVLFRPGPGGRRVLTGRARIGHADGARRTVSRS